MVFLKAKEKAIEYCRTNKLIVPFFSKKVNRVFSFALDIAITEAKHEVFDDIERFEKGYWNKCKRFNKNCDSCLYWKKFGKLRKKHLTKKWK